MKLLYGGLLFLILLFGSICHAQAGCDSQFVSSRYIVYEKDLRARTTRDKTNIYIGMKGVILIYEHGNRLVWFETLTGIDRMPMYNYKQVVVYGCKDAVVQIFYSRCKITAVEIIYKEISRNIVYRK